MYVEFPQGYSVSDIDVTAILLNGELPIVERPYAIGDYDLDEIPDLMVKFDRFEIQSMFPDSGIPEHEVVITGELTNGTKFKGSDTVRMK